MQASICCLSLSMVRNSIASLRARLRPSAKESSIRRPLRDSERRLNGLSGKLRGWLAQGTQTIFSVMAVRPPYGRAPKDRVVLNN